MRSVIDEGVSNLVVVTDRRKSNDEADGKKKREVQFFENIER